MPSLSKAVGFGLAAGLNVVRSDYQARPKTLPKGVIELCPAAKQDLIVLCLTDQPNPKYFKKVIGLAGQSDPSILGLATQSYPRILGPRLSKIVNLRNPTQVIIEARSRNPNSNLIIQLYEK